jgi:hypothetical protein
MVLTAPIQHFSLAPIMQILERHIPFRSCQTTAEGWRKTDLLLRWLKAGMPYSAE